MWCRNGLPMDTVVLLQDSARVKEEELDMAFQGLLRCNDPVEDHCMPGSHKDHMVADTFSNSGKELN